LRRWLPSAFFFAAALCFFAASGSEVKGHDGFTLVFLVGGLLMLALAIKERRQQRHDIESPDSQRS
jgi:hypothetical protein